jgi:hypothetical protein
VHDVEREICPRLPRSERAGVQWRGLAIVWRVSCRYVAHRSSFAGATRVAQQALGSDIATGDECFEGVVRVVVVHLYGR